MPTLENKKIVFRFPEIEEDARFSIDFQRTLRIPDSDNTYPLPPGLGRFPINHVEDYSNQLPESTVDRGGVILPMWQSEAMWLNFHNRGPNVSIETPTRSTMNRIIKFPVAIEIAAGKINAVTGEPWSSRLQRDPQNYVVSPEQPWLDGFCVEKGVIRQFVAMPLEEGFSAEEQLTGNDEWGGLQISVMPLKKDIWLAWRKEKENQIRVQANEQRSDRVLYCKMSGTTSPKLMGLAAGGQMHQSIEVDPFQLGDWDQESAQRIFVTLVHAKDWKSITGEPAPNYPPTAEHYSRDGLPWFEHYAADQKPVSGSKILRGLNSVGKLHKLFTGTDLPDSMDIE